MNARDRDQSIIDEEAGEWLLRISDAPLSEWEKSDFTAWRASDPRHAATYDALVRTWDDASRLQHLRPFADPTPTPSLWQRIASAFSGVASRPGLVSSGLVAAAAAIIAVIYLPPLFDRPDAEYATEIAEIRPVTLPDGSVVTLGARSELDVNFSETERRVTLVSGEAFFEVARNPDRPFFVDAGAASVRVVGTKFDVRRRATGVGVAVLEGEVRVSNERTVREDRARVLRAGDAVEVVGNASALFTPAAVVQPVAPSRAGPAGDWRTGRLTFDGVQLADVAADINRYYAPGLSVSEDAANLRLTASFRANEIERFLGALDAALPVKVTRSPDGAFAARARQPD